MIKTCTFLVSLVSITALLIFGSMQQAYATHCMAMDLTYTCANDSDYTFELHFYRDCGGVPAPGSVVIDLISSSCGITTTLTLSLISSDEVSDLCPASLPSSECNGGTINGVEKYTYSATFFDLAFCTDWVFSYDLCCRNGEIDNINAAGTVAEYTEANLDNSSQECNTSSAFSSNAVPYFCTTQCFTYHNGAYDADGDSLVYSLIASKISAGGTVSYNSPPMSATYPIDTSSGGSLSFDPTTGILKVCPNEAGEYVVTILIEEYRNGVKIADNMQDLQFIVRACTQDQPTLGNITNLSASATLNDSISVTVCPGDSLSFEVIGSDVDVSDDVILTTNLALAIPGASWSTSGTNPATGYFTWVPSGNDTGWHFFTVKAEDEACEQNGTAYNTFIIKVLTGTVASNDTFYCSSGDSITLSVTGGVTYTWAPSTGLNKTTGSSVKAAPSSTITYTVTATGLSASCDTIDSVTVTKVSNFTYVTSSDTDSICSGGLAQLSVGSLSPAGTYYYEWTPASSITDSSVASPYASPTSTTTYTIEVTSDSGCIITDSIEIYVSGIAPTVTATASDSTICPNDTVTLYAVVPTDVTSCSLTGGICLGNPTTSDIGSGGQSTGVGPFYGNNRLYQAQFLYTASAMTAAGCTDGAIRMIGWNIAKQNSTLGYDSFTISLGCTSASDLTIGAWEATTIVYGPTQITPGSMGVGWKTFNLDFEYEWDGTSNLVVQTCYVNDSSTVYDWVTFTSVSYTSATRKYVDSCLSFPCQACDLTSDFSYKTRPNLRLTICSPVPAGITYIWTPTANLYSATSSSPDTLPSPQAIVGATTTFVVKASDGVCEGSSIVTITVDGTVTTTATLISTPPNDTLNCITDTAFLAAVMTGNPLTPDPLVCGANGSSIAGLTIDSGAVGTDATTTTSSGPYQAVLMVDERIQYLYKPSDLTAISMLDGTITRVGWEVATKLSTLAFTGFTISMGCTSSSTLSASAWEATTVVYGPVSVSTTASAWNMYTLAAPYDWDGSSYLVVEVCWDRSTYACANPIGICGDEIKYTDVGGSSKYTMKREAGGFPVIADSTGCDMVSTGAATSAWRPNTRFVFYNASNVGAFTYSWSPPASVDVSTDSSTFGIPTTAQTYIVTVSGGLCDVIDSVSVICVPLPITLLNFEGERVVELINLSWVTMSEVSNDHFVVMRSIDGINFSEIGKIQGAGNSNLQRDYQFDDVNPKIGTNYYKLKQVDYSGKTIESEIIAVDFMPTSITISNIYPNPTTDDINYVILLPADGYFEVEVVDLLGKRLLSDQLKLSKGQHDLTMDLGNLSEGLYFLRVHNIGTRDTDYQKFVKK
ncbi:MAG: T9SS type A sorting domain-containing protein [Bacteroidetes bacterium]|nr:T9SS type A sorting domain-containing protein [Bacteroidota bacterium]